MVSERQSFRAEGRAPAAASRTGDPLLDLLARMIRTAHERERAERRGTLTVVGEQQAVSER